MIFSTTCPNPSVSTLYWVCLKTDKVPFIVKIETETLRDIRGKLGKFLTIYDFSVAYSYDKDSLLFGEEVILPTVEVIG